MYTGAGLSIKENLESVKNELNQEEKFFEQAVKTERFVKKYKRPLITLAGAVLVLIVGMTAYDYYQKNKIEKANAAYLALVKNSADSAAAGDLKSLSPALYDAWQLSVATKTRIRQL